MRLINHGLFAALGSLLGLLLMVSLAGPGNLWALLGDIFAKHGPAVPAVAQTFAPSDFSVRFFLQLAVIMLACRVVGGT